MMETIHVTFPATLPIAKVISVLEGNMAANSAFTCSVKWISEIDGDNGFSVSSDGGPEAFYLIGITASLLIAKHFNEHVNS